MQKPEIWRLVLMHLAPNKFSANADISSTDWDAFVCLHFLPEIRQENKRFYGNFETIEAVIPGMDYTNANHRRRLTSFEHHAKLFSVMDHLRLSNHEIQALCKWKGTKASRERYQRRNAVKIVDTTWSGIATYTQRKPKVTFFEQRPVLTACASPESSTTTSGVASPTSTGSSNLQSPQSTSSLETVSAGTDMPKPGPTNEDRSSLIDRDLSAADELESETSTEDERLQTFFDRIHGRSGPPDGSAGIVDDDYEDDSSPESDGSDDDGYDSMGDHDEDGGRPSLPGDVNNAPIPNANDTAEPGNIIALQNHLTSIRRFSEIMTSVPSEELGNQDRLPSSRRISGVIYA